MEKTMLITLWKKWRAKRLHRRLARLQAEKQWIAEHAEQAIEGLKTAMWRATRNLHNQAYPPATSAFTVTVGKRRFRAQQ
jgi:hypothetical protein